MLPCNEHDWIEIFFVFHIVVRNTNDWGKIMSSEHLLSPNYLTLASTLLTNEFFFAVFFLNSNLRANVCNFRESVDSREFLNFFIFRLNNLYSTLIPKITLKLVTAFYFFRNQVKFDKL